MKEGPTMLGITVGRVLPLVYIISFILFDGCLGQGCSYLEIRKKATKEDVSSLCEASYQTPDCEDFVTSFNRSDLPEGYPRDGLSVDRPAIIDLMSLDTQVNQYMFPGIAVTWESPLTGAGKSLCNGYLVIWALHNGSETRNFCRLFKVDNSKNLASEELVFTTNIDRVYTNSEYAVSVYSMPSPAPDKKDVETFFAKLNIHSGLPYEINVNPGLWAPSVIYQAKSTGTIEVKFTLSPPSFNLTQFNVILSKDYSSDIYLNKTVIEDVRTAEKPQGFVDFTHLSSGVYRIVIWVEDPFRQVEGQCRCWRKYNNIQECSNICGSVRTDWFNLTVTVTTITPRRPPPETTEPESSDPVVSPSRGKKEPENDIVLPAVLGSLAIVAVVIIVLTILWWKRKHNVKGCLHSVLKKTSHQINPPFPEPRPDIQDVNPYNGLVKKIVYILSAEDHKAHSYAAECLAKFLEKHCHCEVIYHPLCDIHHSEGGFTWFINNISRAHRVLFLDSVGALTLLQAHLKNQQYRQRQVGPEGDMFEFGIKHLLAHQDVRENAVLVSFGDKYCGTFLQASITYQLPTHMSQLLQKIHGLSNRLVKDYSHFLPLQVENISGLEEGQELLDAVAAVQDFERKNPHWMDWGRPTPIYQHALSVDSAIGSLPDRSMSVSNQNLSDIDSPNSVIDQPNFSSTDLPSGPPANTSTGMKTSPEYQNIHHVPHDTADSHSFYTIGTDLTTEPVYPVQTQTQRAGIEQGEPCSPWQRNIVPPEAASTFTDFSNAMRNINKDWDSCMGHEEGIISPSCPQAEPRDMEDFQQMLSPPDSLSNVQIDSLSTAFREINRGSADSYQTEQPMDGIVSSDQFDEVNI